MVVCSIEDYCMPKHPSDFFKDLWREKAEKVRSASASSSASTAHRTARGRRVAAGQIGRAIQVDADGAEVRHGLDCPCAQFKKKGWHPVQRHDIGGAAAAAAGGSSPPRAPSSGTDESRSPSGPLSLGQCVSTSPSSARPSCTASPTRRPSSGGTACSPRCSATRTGSCCTTPTGWTRPTSTAPTSPRATGRPGSATYPARSRASAPPSTSTSSPSRSSSATGSRARRA